MNQSTIAKIFLLSAATVSAALGAEPPIGIAPVKLEQGSYTFDTAEQHGIKVSVLAKGLPRSFAMAFLPNGDLLVSERGAQLRLIRAATGAAPALDPTPVAGMPQLEMPYRNGGLHDIALHPDFANNHWLYFTYNKAGPTPAQGQRRQSSVALMRGVYADGKLEKVEELFAAELGSTSGSRIAFAADGTLYMTTGGPFGSEAQDLKGAYGKILRLKDDGGIPADNPYLGRDDVNPAVFSYGHRDQLGLTVHPNGTVLNSEHGPNGGDEVNVVKAATNYGWPTVSFGRNYDGPRISVSPIADDVEQPQLLWVPSIAPSGLMVYTGDKFPAWKGNLFVSSARRGEIERTGGLERVVLTDKLDDIRRETLLTDLHQRIRDVRQGPDGNIYVLTDGEEFAVLRIEPN